MCCCYFCWQVVLESKHSTDKMYWCLKPGYWLTGGLLSGGLRWTHYRLNVCLFGGPITVSMFVSSVDPLPSQCLSLRWTHYRLNVCLFICSQCSSNMCPLYHELRKTYMKPYYWKILNMPKIMKKTCDYKKQNWNKKFIHVHYEILWN